MGLLVLEKDKFVLAFTEKAVKVHGTKYDYSKVIRCDSKTEVEIICGVHGSFFQRKDVHLKGAGCRQCVHEAKKGPKTTTEEYLRKVVDRHGEKYDYSKTVYNGSTKLITITCSKHGDFQQTAAHHYALCACPECSFDAFRLTQEDFLKRANEKHDNFYDYSKVNLTKGFKQKVDIICPVHGLFTQYAGPHMLGNGCIKCGNERSLEKRYPEYTTELFVERAKEVHGDRYNYSLSEYVNTDTKIKIVCSEHGVFEQRPLCHTRGKGCVKCRNDNTTYNFIQKYRDNPELGNKDGIIYILSIFNEEEKFLKVGITSNKKGRFKRYRTQLGRAGYSFEILHESFMPNYQTAMLENEILKDIRKNNKLHKPSFDFSGKSECICVDSFDYLISRINSHTEDKYFH